jgi:hypothetical protein
MSRSYYIQMMKQKDERIAELEKEKGVLIQAGCDLCFYAEHTEEHRRAREEFPCRYD